MAEERITAQEMEEVSSPAEEPSEFEAFLAEVRATAKEQGRQSFFVFPTRYSAHELTVDKVSFRVLSHFNGKCTLDKLLASLMLEDVNRPSEPGEKA